MKDRTGSRQHRVARVDDTTGAHTHTPSHCEVEINLKFSARHIQSSRAKSSGLKEGVMRSVLVSFLPCVFPSFSTL